MIFKRFYDDNLAQASYMIACEKTCEAIVIDPNLDVAQKSLGPKDAVPLGRHIIHSVSNPHSSHTGAIHVYGGDFFGAPGRSEWDPETLLERPWNAESLLRCFERGTLPTS